jgi:hypothetical protein
MPAAWVTMRVDEFHGESRLCDEIAKTVTGQSSRAVQRPHAHAGLLPGECAACSERLSPAPWLLAQTLVRMNTVSANSNLRSSTSRDDLPAWA